MMMNKIKFRKDIEMLGKGALTAICPPVGLAVSMKDRTIGAGIGMISSILVSLVPVLSIHYETSREIYDDPRISTSFVPFEHNLPATGKFVAGLFLSPLVFYSNFGFETNLESGEKTHSIVGRDVVNFSKESKTYTLNFGPERKFLDSNGRSVSLNDAKQKSEALTANGDILEARKAFVDYERIREEYNATREVYEDTVSKMNLELTGLSKKLEESK